MRRIRTALTQGLEFQENGPASAEKTIERLAEAYKLAITQSNRLSYTSIAVAGLYAIKVFGMRVDIIVFDQKVFELPYGLFVFCVVSQVIFVGSCIRAMDARVIDRAIKDICDKKFNDVSGMIYMSLRGAQEWSGNLNFLMIKLTESLLLRFVYAIISLTTACVVISLILSPLTSGVFFLVNSTTQISGEAPEAQFYIVLSSTILSAIVFWFTATIHFVDRDPV